MWCYWGILVDSQIVLPLKKHMSICSHQGETDNTDLDHKAFQLHLDTEQHVSDGFVDVFQSSSKVAVDFNFSISLQWILHKEGNRSTFPNHINWILLKRRSTKSQVEYVQANHWGNVCNLGVNHIFWACFTFSYQRYKFVPLVHLYLATSKVNWSGNTNVLEMHPTQCKKHIKQKRTDPMCVCVVCLRF